MLLHLLWLHLRSTPGCEEEGMPCSRCQQLLAGVGAPAKLSRSRSQLGFLQGGQRESRSAARVASHRAACRYKTDVGSSKMQMQVIRRGRTTGRMAFSYLSGYL